MNEFSAPLKANEATYCPLARPGMAADLCMTDPGFDIDLFIETDSKALAAIWMGYASWRTELSQDRIFLSGDARLIKTIDNRTVRSSYGAA